MAGTKGGPVRISRPVRAMNALGDAWLAHLKVKAAAEGKLDNGGITQFPNAFDGWRNFADWLASQYVDKSVVHEFSGKLIPDRLEEITFRNTLPDFPIFQDWYYYKVTAARRELAEELGLQVEDAAREELV